MAGLTWFELDVDMPDDPKCMALAARLRNPLAFGHVVRLYAYCYKHGSDRFSGPGAAGIIEEAARWKGKTGALVTALLAEEFLEREGDDTLVVHGVAARLAPHLAARRHAADRQRRRRDKAVASLERHASRDASVTRDVTRDDGVSHTDNRDRNRDREEETSSLRSEGAPPAAPAPAATGSAAGGGEPPESPPPEGPPSAPKSEPAGFAQAVRHWYAAWERTGRGKHARLTGAEGKQLKALLADVGLEELQGRMDRALADPWFLANGDLLTFVKQRNRFARPGGRGAPAADERTKRLEDAIARACPEWAAILRAAARPVSAGGIDGDVLDRVLVDVEAERSGDVLRLRARDEFHAEELADRWQDRLVAAARRVTGESVHVQVVGLKGGGEEAA